MVLKNRSTDRCKLLTIPSVISTRKGNGMSQSLPWPMVHCSPEKNCKSVKTTETDSNVDGYDYSESEYSNSSCDSSVDERRVSVIIVKNHTNFDNNKINQISIFSININNRNKYSVPKHNIENIFLKNILSKSLYTKSTKTTKKEIAKYYLVP